MSPIMHPGDVDEGPVPAVDEYLCPVAGCDFAVGATGPVDPDEPDDFRDEVEEHRRRHEPVDSASHRSSSQAGLASLSPSGGAVTSTPAPSEAPPDHGPLAAALSDRTLDKVLSRPAHVPSLVMLDRDAAAQHLAAAVDDLLAGLAISPHRAGRSTIQAARQALAEYRETLR